MNAIALPRLAIALAIALATIALTARLGTLAAQDAPAAPAASVLLLVPDRVFLGT